MAEYLDNQNHLSLKVCEDNVKKDIDTFNCLKVYTFQENLFFVKKI